MSEVFPPSSATPCQIGSYGEGYSGIFSGNWPTLTQAETSGIIPAMRAPTQVPQFPGQVPGISAMPPTQPGVSAAQVAAMKQQAASALAAEIFVRAAADAIAIDPDQNRFREMARAAKAAAEAYFDEGG